MSPAPSSRPRHAAKPLEDFEWPPTADELSVYEMGPDPWQKLQDASSQAFQARRRESPQPRRIQPAQLPPPSTRMPSIRTRAIVLAASAILAGAAGWALYRGMTRPVPVHAVHHPAPAAEVTAPPPSITIVATYPVAPDRPSAPLVDREPAVTGNGEAAPPVVSGDAPRAAIDPEPDGTAAAATSAIAPDPEPAGAVTPIDAPAAADTKAGPAENVAPPSAR